MHKHLLILFLLIALGIPVVFAPSVPAADDQAGTEAAAASTPGEEEEPFIDVVDVNVVNVEVFVTDKKGVRVTGLGRDDFELFVDDKPVAITNFYAVENGKAITGGEAIDPLAEPEAPVRPLGESTVPVDQRLHLVVYVDNFNISPLNRNRVLGQARTFLRTKLRPDDQVMLVTFDRSLHTRHPFTRDPELIASALYEVEDLSGWGNRSDADRREILQLIYDADNEQEVRGRVTLYAESIYNDLNVSIDALRDFVESLAGLPGRKAVLYLSDGIAMRAGEDAFYAIDRRFGDSSAVLEAQRFDVSRRFQQLVDLANANRVTFYTLDAAGLRTFSYQSAQNAGPGGGTYVDEFHFSNVQSPLRLMAAETGGMAILNTNNVAPLLERVAEDFGTYYSLGFTAQAGNNRYHEIKVKVKDGKKLDVRSREGFRDKPASARVADGTLAALNYGFQDNSLEIELEFGQETPGEGGHFHVPVTVKIPMGHLSFLPQNDIYRARVRLFVAVRDEEGRSAPIQEMPVSIEIPSDKYELAQTSAFQQQVTLLMRKGRQVIALGVRDEIGSETAYLTRGVSIGS